MIEPDLSAEILAMYSIRKYRGIRSRYYSHEAPRELPDSFHQKL